MKKNESTFGHIATQPGVYIYKNSDGTVLYVGKAKNLRKRVASYFQKQDHGAKTEALVRHIAHTETIVTHNELEALLLENQLIKKYRPHYNIQLKDTARYQYICITNEKFPQVKIVRRKNKQDRFFGPYTFSLREIPRIAKEIFGLRYCKPTQKEACLYYKMGLCSGVCAGAVCPQKYAQYVQNFMQFLKQDTQVYIDRYTAAMYEASQARDFEKALRFKQRIALLQRLKERQYVERIASYNQDVIAIVALGEQSCVSVLHITQGVLRHKQDFAFPSSNDLRNAFLKTYYMTCQIPHEIIIDGPYDHAIEAYLTQQAGRKVRILFPQKGDKKELLALARKNALAYFNLENTVLIALQNMLGLARLPRVIDAFDISNYSSKVIGGACVRYTNGVPEKSAYRVYTMRTVHEQDDFRSMYETVERRYKSLALPDLIIIDGGLQQVAFAQKALSDHGLECPVVGLAKEEETIVIDERTRFLLDRSKPASKLILRMRDAVHILAREHIRKQYKKAYKQSFLDTIPGIGPQSKFALLHHFGSLSAIKHASKTDLTKIIGASKTDRLIAYLQEYDD